MQINRIGKYLVGFIMAMTFVVSFALAGTDHDFKFVNNTDHDVYIKTELGPDLKHSVNNREELFKSHSILRQTSPETFVYSTNDLTGDLWVALLYYDANGTKHIQHYTAGVEQAGRDCSRTTFSIPEYNNNNLPIVLWMPPPSEAQHSRLKNGDYVCTYTINIGYRKH